MAAGNSGMFFALMLYCFIQSMGINTGPMLTESEGVILKDSWGYLLGRVSTQRISFGHGQLYNTLISALFVSHEGRGRPRSNRRLITSTKTTVSLDELLVACSLLLCGDIHPCPGPTVPRTPKYPWLLCQGCAEEQQSGCM